MLDANESMDGCIGGWLDRWMIDGWMGGGLIV